MKKVRLSDGTEVLFQVTSNEEAFGTQSLHDTVECNLEKISSIGGNVLKDSVNQIRRSLDSAKPDELEIEIGLSLGYEGSIFISKGSAEANITIKATWKLKE